MKIPALSFPFKGHYPLILSFGSQPVDNALKKKYRQWGIVGHHGLDFGLPEGMAVVASDSAEVIQAGDQGDFGIAVTLKHAWGESLYAHLRESLVVVGQKVKRGEKLGLSGQTGVATGAHLHFGIKPNNPNLVNGYLGFIDPWPYLRSYQEDKLGELASKLAKYETKLAQKMKRYRGVIHESGVSEMKHQEVMVLRAMIDSLKQEIASIKQNTSIINE